MRNTPPHVPPQSRALFGAPPRREPHPLVYCCFVFYWRPPNAWAPSPSLFSRCVAFRHPKQPPQRELNDIARARRRAQCYELARRAGPGGGKRRGRNGRQRAMGGGVLYFTSRCCLCGLHFTRSDIFRSELFWLLFCLLTKQPRYKQKKRSDVGKVRKL